MTPLPTDNAMQNAGIEIDRRVEFAGWPIRKNYYLVRPDFIYPLARNIGNSLGPYLLNSLKTIINRI